MGLQSGNEIDVWRENFDHVISLRIRRLRTPLTMNRLLEQKLNDLNRVLKKYFERNVQLSQKRTNDALHYWKPIVDRIIDYVKKNDDRFASLSRFGSGSYYERAKVREPDEFDLMLIFEDLTVTSMVSSQTGPGMTVQPPLGRWWIAIHNKLY